MADMDIDDNTYNELANIADALEDSGSPAVAVESLLTTLSDSGTSIQFRDLIYGLTSKITALDSTLPQPSSAPFPRNLHQLLDALEYPFPDSIRRNFAEFESRVHLLSFLVAELQVSRMLLNQAQQAASVSSSDYPEEPASPSSDVVMSNLSLESEEGSPESRELSEYILRACDALGVTAAGSDPIATLRACCESLRAKLPSSLSAPVVVTRAELAGPRMAELENIQRALRDEYNIRRQMLLKRLDVTIESFLNSARAKAKSGEIRVAVDKLRRNLVPEPHVRMADIFVATGDVLAAEQLAKVSDLSYLGDQMKSFVKRVIIGSVPDRGGRVMGFTGTMAATGPEFKSREEGASSSGGGGRGGKGGWSGGRGGRGGRK